jgi:hypothetical protein
MASFNVEPFAVPRPLPLSLGFVSGFIDACTFSALFRSFVAQVTGSFVITDAQLVDANRGMVVPIIAIPTFFLVGIDHDAAIGTIRANGLGRSDGCACNRNCIGFRIFCDWRHWSTVRTSERTARGGRKHSRHLRYERPKHIGTPADGRHSLNQRDDDKYDSTWHRCGRMADRFPTSKDELGRS